MINNQLKYFHIKGLRFPYQTLKIIRLTLFTWLAMASILFTSILFFDYEITNADIPCGSIAGILLAYLIYVSITDENDEATIL